MNITDKVKPPFSRMERSNRHDLPRCVWLVVSGMVVLGSVWVAVTGRLDTHSAAAVDALVLATCTPYHH